MKNFRKLFLAGILCLPVLANAQYLVHVKLNENSDAVKAYLMHENGRVDSAMVAKGTCQFKGTVEDVARVNLVVVHKNDRVIDRDALSFYIENGKIQVSGTERIKDAIISGSKINADLKKYEEQFAPVQKEVTDVILSLNAKQDDKAFMESWKMYYDSAMAQQYRFRAGFISQHPDAYISLIVLKDMIGTRLINSEFDPAVTPVFSRLSERMRTTAMGMALKKDLEREKAALVGSTAPDFTQNDINDQPVSLKDFRGKYVLLDFWASWCGPCRKENPSVVKAYANFKDKGFTVLSVSLDMPGEKNKWTDAIKADGLDWTNVSDLKGWSNELVKLYSIKGVPQNFLIDPKGKIIAKGLRGEDLEKKLAEVLNN